MNLIKDTYKQSFVYFTLTDIGQFIIQDKIQSAVFSAFILEKSYIIYKRSSSHLRNFDELCWTCWSRDGQLNIIRTKGDLGIQATLMENVGVHF